MKNNFLQKIQGATIENKVCLISFLLIMLVAIIIPEWSIIERAIVIALMLAVSYIYTETEIETKN